MIFSKKDKSTKMSLPETRLVHGVEIRKVPIGQYVKAMRELEDLPQVIVEKCFPGKSMAQIMATFTAANEGTVVALIGRLLVVLPEHVVQAVCSIIGLDSDKVMNELTPKELLDIVKAYWELNDMSDFFGTVWGLIKTKLPTLITGSNAGSPSPSPSASASRAS